MDREKIVKQVVVLGAGVTGLTAAWALRRAGHRVHVLERSARAGGAIRSTREDGFLVEAGPNTMLLNEPRLLDFFHDIGLRDELVEASPHARNRFIVRAGRPVAAPMSPGQFLGTPLLSARAKWRLLREPFVRRPRREDEESIAAFAARRLGREVVDYAINPLIAGIYAGDPERLSLRHTFPTLHRFEREHGSLVRGALAAARARRKSGQPRFKSRSISFRSGLQAIIDALVHQVGDSLHTRVELDALAPGPPWRVRFSRTGETATEVNADALVVAIPAHAAAALPFSSAVGQPLASLAQVEYPPVTTIALGFRRDQIAHPLDGYGVLVPAKENLRVLGTLFNSSLFPARAPEGCALLTSFVGGMRQPALAALPRDEVQALVVEDLRRLLGIAGAPLFASLTAWPRAIPQYQLGYGSILATIEAAEKRLPGLFIGGQCRDGVSVGDCIRAGLRLAARAA